MAAAAMRACKQACIPHGSDGLMVVMAIGHGNGDGDDVVADGVDDGEDEDDDDDDDDDDVTTTTRAVITTMARTTLTANKIAPARFLPGADGRTSVRPRTPFASLFRASSSIPPNRSLTPILSDKEQVLDAP